MESAWILDGTVALLLAATIYFAIRLERKLDAMRSIHTAMTSAIRDLNAASQRAEAGIQGMKAAAHSSGQALDDRIRRARMLNDQLALLVESGQRLAQRSSVPDREARTRDISAARQRPAAMWQAGQ